jgi:hypothetical protein
VLHSAHRPYFRLLGTNLSEFVCTRCHVLVLFPECAWRSRILEAMDHPFPDHPVRDRLGYVSLVTSFFAVYDTNPTRLCLFRFVGLLHQHIRAIAAARRHLRRRTFCCHCGRCNSKFISRSVHLILHRNLSKDVKSP